MKIYFAKNLLIYPSYYQRIALNLINVIKNTTVSIYKNIIQMTI